MLRQAVNFLAVIVVLLAIFVLVERTSSPFFQSCIRNQQNSASDPTAKNNPPSYGAIVVKYVACSGLFIERHGVGFTALATFIIAAFTCTLWLATSRQAELTREALVADKAAFVFPIGFNQFWEPDAVTGHYNWRFSMRWFNSGDTAGRDVMVHAECEIRNTAFPARRRSVPQTAMRKSRSR